MSIGDENTWRCLAVAIGGPSTFESSGLDILAQSLAIVVRGQHKSDQPAIIELTVIAANADASEAEAMKERIIKTAELPYEPLFQVQVIDRGSASAEVAPAFANASIFLCPQSTGDFGAMSLDAISTEVPVLVSASSGVARMLLEKAPPLAAMHIVGVQRNMSLDATEWSSRINDELTNRSTSLARAKRLRFALEEANALSAAPAAKQEPQQEQQQQQASCESALAAFDASVRSKEPGAVGATLSLLVSWFEQFDGYDELYPRWEKIAHVFRDQIDLSIFIKGGEGTEALAIATAKTIFYRQKDLSADDRLDLLNAVRALLKPTQYYAAAKIDLERAEMLANTDDPQALPICLDAVSAAEQMQDPWFLGLAMLSHATVLARLKRYKEAREVADKAIAVFETRGSRHAIANLERLKAEIALRQEPRDIVGASVFTAEAIKGFQVTKDSIGEAHALLARAEVLFSRNRADEALVQFDRAVKLYDTAEMRTMQGRALMRRSNLHLERHNHPEAIRDLEAAEKYLADSPETLMQIQCLISQGDAHARMQDHAWIVDRIDEIEEMAMALKPTVKTVAILVQLCGLAKTFPVPDKPRIRRMAACAIEIAKSCGNVEAEGWAQTFLTFAG